MLITVFGLLVFGLVLTGRAWTSAPNWVPSGLWLKCYNTPKLQKLLYPDLNRVFPKCGDAPNTQNSYSFTLWLPLGLHNTSLDAKFRSQNFSFVLIKQWLKVPGSTVFLNWGKCSKYTKRCITQLTISLYASVAPYLMQDVDLKTFEVIYYVPPSMS